MTQKTKARIALTAFLTACLIPSAGMLLLPQGEAAANQTLAPAPRLFLEDGSFNTQVLDEVTDYVADHFAFRQEMITASARLELSLSCWYAVRASALPEDPGRLETSAAAEGGVWRPGEEPAFWTKTYTLEGEPLEPGAFAFWLTPEGTDPVEERALGAACTWSLYWWERYRGDFSSSQPVRCTAVAVFYDREGNELARAELTDIQGGV